MARRSLYRYKVQYSLRTLLMVMATVPVLVFLGKWIATIPLVGLGSFGIGVCVAWFAYWLLKPEEIRTLLLQVMVSALVGFYAFWIPEGFLYYITGVGVGILLTTQGAAILTFLCASYGICQVRVYENPRWQPARRDVPWPMGQYDSTVV